MKHFFLLILFPLFFTNCNKSKTELSKDVVEKISNKYSKEALNYFYEVSFYDEVQKEIIPLKRWSSNVSFGIKGNPLPNDEKFVKNAINIFNDLGLNIKFSFTQNIKEANVIINFGNSSNFKNIDILSTDDAIGKVFSKNNTIYRAEVFILEKILNDKERESMILEELTQIFVGGSDSFSYPESIFFQGQKTTPNFTKLDKEVIKLAYDSLIPVGYTLKQFEKDFVHKLNYVNTSLKLKKSFVEAKIKTETLDEIKKSCFIDKEFYKHPKVVSVYVYGFNHSDSIFVEKSIKSLNKISKNFSLVLRKKTDLSADAGILITVKPNNQQTSDTQTLISNVKGEVFKPKRFKSIVDIDYKESITINKKQNVILKSIFKALGPTEMHSFGTNWYVYKNDEIVIAKEYTDILKTIYEDEFVDGLKADEFDKIID